MHIACTFEQPGCREWLETCIPAGQTLDCPCPITYTVRMTVRYLTTAEMAARRGVSPHTITRWARMGLLPESTKVGRFWLHHPQPYTLEPPR